MEEKTEVVAPSAPTEVAAPVTMETAPVTVETAPVTVLAAPGKHSEMVVLNKRKVCWANRDAFFACMDKNDNNQDLCTAEKTAYYDICPGSWVKHFNKLRIQSKYKSGIGRLKKAGIPVPETAERDEAFMSQNQRPG